MRARSYLMCPPEHFTVEYAINPWMKTGDPVDPGLAMRQWQTLRDTDLALGHRVELIDAVPGLPVVCLRLIDPRYYHLDTALCVLGPGVAAYYPAAFDDAGKAALSSHFTELVEAKDEDAEVLGLNAVSDGRHVVLPAQARGLADQVAARGFEPVPVDMPEFRKAGGGPKCCTLELGPGKGA
jgi:N-dimethylarginine dimethylaminohydrolase